MSVYSAIMAVIWFTAAALIGSYTLHHASRYGLTIVAATLFLSVLRIFCPWIWTTALSSARMRSIPFCRS